VTGTLVVVGDTLLDRDVDGMVNRLCPDSPVPVLDESVSVERPGGAGLAALLAARRGWEVALVTALADDIGGARLSTLLTAAGVQVYPVPAPGSTAEKIRLRTRGRVLIRHDRGGPTGPVGPPAGAVLDLLAGASAILVSDYGRGMTRQPELRAALAATTAPVVWDPHPRGPAAVPGVRLLTPNEVEARELAGIEGTGPRLAVAARGARTLRHRWSAAAVAVTLGGEGALLCHAGATPLVVPAPNCADGDTCGAGDRFAAAAALALARGALVSEAVEEAVAEACAFVARGGVAAAVPMRGTRTGVLSPAAAGTVGVAVPVGSSVSGHPSAHPSPPAPIAVTPPDRGIGLRAAAEVVATVRAAGGTVVATGGCFDLLHAGHVATLEAARGLGDCLVVCLNSDRSVTGLKGADRPMVTEADRSRILAALSCVDAVIIFDEPTPHAALSWLRPDIWVKGGDYAADGGDGPALPEAALVRRWGGHTVVVPYLDGRSSSALIDRVRAGARVGVGGAR
jgi:D-beta-D-heptose 7-phosphate kinase/D-beta-D-heptose 1-phosphate adenosyltransferase